MKYSFLSAGSLLEHTEEGRLYLDVGNNLMSGIIDHHQLEGLQKSATRLIYENSHLILDGLESIIVHNSPDLDCVASSFMAEYYKINKIFPPFSEELCEFVDKADFGLPLNNIINLSTLFTIIKSQSNSDYEIIKQGHKLISDIEGCGFDTGNFPIKYQDEANQIIEDMKIFEKDIQKSSVQTFHIQNRVSKKIEIIKGLILKKPQSKLFKFWARDKGYDLLIVLWDKKRTVISLKGDSYYTLEGIGNKLNDLEAQKRKELNIIINEPNRVGYNIPDPWYDGRAHGYTIIDAPRSGTQLELEDILNLIRRS